MGRISPGSWLRDEPDGHLSQGLLWVVQVQQGMVQVQMDCPHPHASIGTTNCTGFLEIVMNWPEGENFDLLEKEEQEQVSCAEEASPWNQQPQGETLCSFH